MTYTPPNINGQATSANSAPVVIASNQSTLPISASTLPLPTGAALETGGNLSSINTNTANTATSANQTNGNQKAIARGGAKGTTVAADVTSNPIDVNTQALHVDGSKVTQPVSIATMPTTPVTGTFFQATQPVSGTVTANTGLVQPLTDTQLRATSVPVSGTFFQPTQPISGTVTANTGLTQPLTDTQLRLTAVPVSLATAPTTPVTGTFFQATQPVSLAVAPTTPVTGTFFQTTQPVSLAVAPTTPVTGTFFQATQPVSLATNTPTLATGANIIGKVGIDQTIPGTTNQIAMIASQLIVSTTGAAGAAVTATLPAVVGQFHYITRINIVKYASVAVIGAAAPVIVSSTNLNGTLTWTTPTAQAIGTQYETDLQPASPIKSSVVNTATTIVCPLTTSILWRVNVYYYTAA